MSAKKLTKGEATRNTIEMVAIRLFTEQGYHSTSMRQIAKKADLALSGIYNHFDSKEDIFKAIIVDHHPYKKILPLVVDADGETAREFFGNAFRIVIDELGKHPEFINLLFIELVEFKGKHGAVMLLEIAPNVLPIFEKVIKTKQGLRVTNPAILMRSFLGMIISYFITEMLIADSVVSKLMPQNSTELYIELFLNGVLKESA